MRFRSLLPLPLFFAASSLFACAAPSDSADATESDITSKDGKILDFTFDAEVVTSANTDARTAVVSQLMYAQGILTTARHGNGHVGNVKLSIASETAEGAKKRVKYKASLPVAWPKNTESPKSYELALPLDATDLYAFNTKYDGKCGRNEYGVETFWHDWNPKASGCTIDDADVVRAKADDIKPHAKETSDKYPEYTEMWKDGRLDVVAIFGIISSNTPSDYGYGEARRFLDGAKAKLKDAKVTDDAKSASILQQQTLTGKATIDGTDKDVSVTVIVVQELQSVRADFDATYDTLSEKADLILYNGHAGLGKNVNALARKGKVAKDKYQLVLMNGCQTFAYLDTTIFDRRREANGAQNDPDGTKFLDVMGNALPGYANNLASMSSTLFAAAVTPAQPKSYRQLMETMPASHIVVVFGEEDNRFTP